MRNIALTLAVLAMGSPAPALSAQSPQISIAVATDTALNHWWLLDPETEQHPGTAVERAYRELLQGRAPRDTITVAILDTGIDIDHPDLRPNLWTNPREVAGNGQDDDGNGYVDDLHGWNFIGGPSGDVDTDSYEVTRLYGRLRARCEAPEGPSFPECADFARIKAGAEEQRASAEQQLVQLQSIYTGFGRIRALLQQATGQSELTLENVGALETSAPSVARAREAWLTVTRQGVTWEDVERQYRAAQLRVQFNRNPESDEVRRVVGDRYADLSERHYGNANVEGPDPEHGTHVAGIIGAVRGNGLGLDGIASAVRLMSVRTVPDGDERDKDVANAIRYAVDNGARIINLSFGKGFSPEKSAVDEAVRYAEARSVLIVHAAGNDGADTEGHPSYPVRTYVGGGEATNWLEVGASSWSTGAGLLASFSNYGRKTVDLFAPGEAIYSTLPDEGYGKLSGTSMASPVVAGVAALVLSHYPELSAAELRQILLDSATRYEGVRIQRPGDGGEVTLDEISASGGVVNAYRALQLAAERAGQKK